ncbi:class F sortase, partial [Streptomyces sp. SID10116]|nr:class F sortase [Streptomyces sp. SID10116]
APSLGDGPPPSPAPEGRIRIPAIGVDADVLPVGLDRQGALEVPPFRDALKVGWYELGPRPGDRGPAILVGHRDAPAERGGRGRRGYRDAVFARLDRLRPGDRIETRTAAGRRTTFNVTEVATYRTADFPTATVYAPAIGAQLRLITCGGRIGRNGHWDSNVVVSAARVATPERNTSPAVTPPTRSTGPALSPSAKSTTPRDPSRPDPPTPLPALPPSLPHESSPSRSAAPRQERLSGPTPATPPGRSGRSSW